jgi:hypothetical protein
MKAKKTKSIANSCLLANFVRGLTSLEQIGVSFWNHGTGRGQSNCIGTVVIVFTTITLPFIAFGGGWYTVLGSISSSTLLGFYIFAHTQETKSKRQFEAAKHELDKAEAVMEAIFSGYSTVDVQAESRFSHDHEKWSYLLDWTRSELMKLVVMIENGDESMRGELRIKFRVAQELFGDAMDRNQGFDYFFTRKCLKDMRHFKDMEQALTELQQVVCRANPAWVK